MTTNPSFPRDIALQHRGLYTIDDAAGLRLDCREGALWVTLDNDPRDIVISAGESFTVAEHRRAIVYALEGSRLSVSVRRENAPTATATARLPQTAPASACAQPAH